MLHFIFNDIKTEILLTESSDFLKQLIFLKSFNSVFYMDVLVDTGTPKTQWQNWKIDF